jgi:hypothetical protein
MVLLLEIRPNGRFLAPPCDAGGGRTRNRGDFSDFAGQI